MNNNQNNSGAVCRDCNANVTDAEGWYPYQGNDFQCVLCGSTRGAVYYDDDYLRAAELPGFTFFSCECDTIMDAVKATFTWNDLPDYVRKFYGWFPLREGNDPVGSMQNDEAMKKFVLMMKPENTQRLKRKVRDALNKGNLATVTKMAFAIYPGLYNWGM